jgi:anthranilate phosphoribosyltransferase
MNMLGPCVNPAGPGAQLLGVADPKLLEPVAQTLAGLGIANALVVHGAGLDELALHGETDAIRISGGVLEPLRITPEQAGLTRAPWRRLPAAGRRRMPSGSRRSCAATAPPPRMPRWRSTPAHC